MDKLSSTDIQSSLDKLDDWDLVDGKLYKEYTFKDFNQAFEFMKLLAKIAAKLDHHPDWSNSYNKVVIRLATHSVGGITATDFKLAKAAEQIAANLYVSKVISQPKSDHTKTDNDFLF